MTRYSYLLDTKQENLLIRLALTSNSFMESVGRFIEVDRIAGVQARAIIAAAQAHYAKTGRVSRDTVYTTLRGALVQSKEMSAEEVDKTAARAMECADLPGDDDIVPLIAAMVQKGLKDTRIDELLADPTATPETIAGRFNAIANVGAANGLTALSIASTEEARRFLKEEKELVFNSTGNKQIDVLMMGGFEDYSMWCLAAESGTGKSMFLSTLVGHQLRASRDVLVVTLELSKELWTKRALQAALSSGGQINGRLEVAEQRGSDRTLSGIRSHLQARADVGHHYDLLVIDYLDLVAPKDNRIQQYEMLRHVYEEARGLCSGPDPLVRNVWTASQVRRTNARGAATRKDQSDKPMFKPALTRDDIAGSAWKLNTVDGALLMDVPYDPDTGEPDNDKRIISICKRRATAMPLQQKVTVPCALHNYLVYTYESNSSDVPF